MSQNFRCVALKWYIYIMLVPVPEVVHALAPPPSPTLIKTNMHKYNQLRKVPSVNRRKGPVLTESVWHNNRNI